MKKFVLVFLCFYVLMFFTNCVVQQDLAIVKINNKIFQVELVQTAEEHHQGLSGRESLTENQGMLFVFDDYQVRTFVMRDMNFPLDIIWIKDNQVVGCEKNVPILNVITHEISQVISSEPINYVLEINAGLCEKYNIQKGDNVDISLE